MGPDNTLLLYTDGLIKHNPRIGDEHALVRLLGSLSTAGAEELLSELENAAFGTPRRQPRDDVAMLMLRVPRSRREARRRRPAPRRHRAVRPPVRQRQRWWRARHQRQDRAGTPACGPLALPHHRSTHRAAAPRASRTAAPIACQHDGANLFSVTREASGQPRGRPARVNGHRPRTSEQRASVRESLQRTPAPGPQVPRPDQRERRSAQRGAGRRYVGRVPAGSCHGRRQASGDPPIPAVSRAARTSPTARQPPNRRRPDARLANRHGANRSAQRGTGRAPRLPPPLRARTRDRPGVAVRHPRSGRSPRTWRAPAQSAAACVVHLRSLHRTRPAARPHSALLRPASRSRQPVWLRRVPTHSPAVGGAAAETQACASGTVDPRRCRGRTGTHGRAAACSHRDRTASRAQLPEREASRRGAQSEASADRRFRP